MEVVPDSLEDAEDPVEADPVVEEPEALQEEPDLEVDVDPHLHAYPHRL